MMLFAADKISPEAFMTVPQQAELFLLSVIMGAVFGVIYDVFRAARVVIPPLRRAVPTAVCDILFFVICGVGIFLFSLTFAGGSLRGFFWVGALIGWAIYFFTIGSLILGIIRGIFGGLYKLIGSAAAAVIKRHKKNS